MIPNTLAEAGAHAAFGQPRAMFWKAAPGGPDARRSGRGSPCCSRAAARHARLIEGLARLEPIDSSALRRVLRSKRRRFVRRALNLLR
ncbi:MAG: hypothetical protein ACQEUZ_16745 [Pseudomonadota bacterium]